MIIPWHSPILTLANRFPITAASLLFLCLIRLLDDDAKLPKVNAAYNVVGQSLAYLRGEGVR